MGDCTVPARTGGRFKTAHDIIAAVKAGDADANGVWKTSLRSLAAALAGFINVLDPEVIVIGGGIAAGAGDELFVPLHAMLERFEWRPAGAKVRLVKAALGIRAGAIGAARHALDTYRIR